ncbi:hypothetical protein [Nostoc sp. WHI]|uniref:hypothetical protein n=1 Tax=Nostoc sp. WHI TaxID=2650611 RepID=UPI0018C45D58|nr:hypothetical protein [Nostoc sp. WHI]
MRRANPGIADVSAQSESYFLRNQIAKAFGAKAGFGIPIVERNIVAILVFFMSEIWEQDMEIIAATEAIVRRYAKCGTGTTFRNEDDHII